MAASDGPVFARLRLRSQFDPAETDAGAVDAVTDSSLVRVSVAETALVSFAPFPSSEPVLKIETLEFTVAPLASDDAVVKTTANDRDPPLAMRAVLHWILFVRSEQAESEPEALNVVPDGLATSTTTVLASDGPPLVTIAVTVTSAPALAVLVMVDVVTERSAVRATVDVSAFESFVETRSVDALDTETVLERLVPADAAAGTAKFTVNDEEPPEAMLLAVHVTGVPDVQPLDV